MVSTDNFTTPLCRPRRLRQSAALRELANERTLSVINTPGGPSLRFQVMASVHDALHPNVVSLEPDSVCVVPLGFSNSGTSTSLNLAPVFELRQLIDAGKLSGGISGINVPLAILLEPHDCPAPNHEVWHEVVNGGVDIVLFSSLFHSLSAVATLVQQRWAAAAEPLANPFTLPIGLMLSADERAMVEEATSRGWLTKTRIHEEMIVAAHRAGASFVVL